MHIEFQNLKINYFKSILEANWDLGNEGIFLVKGFNKDKGGSNGSGKTTLIDALLWCLFGKTLSAEKADEIINNKKKGNTFVTCKFKRGNELFEITRYREHSDFANAVHLNNITREKTEDLSGLTSRDGTNEKIEQLIGANYNQFVDANVFCSSEDHIPFLAMTDTQRKDALIPPTTIKKFNKASIKVNNKIKDVDAKGLELTNNIALSQKDIESANRQIEIYEDKIKEIKEDNIQIQLKLGELESQGTQTKADLAQVNKAISELNERLVKTIIERKTIEEDFEAYKELIQDIDKTTYKLEEVSLQTSKRIADKEKLETRHASSKTRKLELEAKIKSISVEIDNILGTYHALMEVIQNTKVEQEKYDSVELVSSKLNEVETKIANNLYKIKGKYAEKQKLLGLIQNLNNYISDKCKTCEHNKVSNIYTDYNNQIEEIVNDTIPLSKLDTKLSVERQNLELLKTKVVALQDKYQTSVQENFELKHKLDKLHSDVHNQNELLNELANKNDYFENLDTEIDSLKAQENNLGVIFNKLNTRKNNLHGLKESRDAIVQEELELQESLTSLMGKKASYEEKVNSLRNLYSSVKNSLRDPGSHGDQITRLKEELITFDNNLALIKVDQEKLEDERYALNFWKEAFSSTGIESFMIGETIDAINERIVVYADILSKGTIDVNMTPTRLLKSGKSVNKSAVNIDNKFGAKTYKGSSKGERQAMNIAALLARKDITQLTTGHSWNILFMDEIFTKLDVATCSLVIGVIKQLKSATSIYVVSHKETVFMDFSAYISVEKKNGISSIKEVVY